MTEWFTELTAIFHSRRFTPFLSGIELSITPDQKYFVKVLKTTKSIRPLGFRFSKYSFVTEVAAGEHVGTGYGEAESKLVALQKSIAEGVERAIFLAFTSSLWKTSNSNGWAAHLSRRSAFSSALDELLERDAVLVHWLTESPFTEIMPATWPAWLQSWAKSELSQAERFRRLRILKSHLGHIPTVTTVLMDSDGFGVVSHSAGRRFNTALSRALAETCRIAHFILEQRNTSIEEVNLNTPTGHSLFYVQAQPLPSWVFGQKSDWRTCINEWNNARAAFCPRQLKPKFHQIISHPLVVGYTTSPLVQNLYFGTTESAHLKANLNLKRLHTVRSGYLNPMPHFIP